MLKRHPLLVLLSLSIFAAPAYPQAPAQTAPTPSVTVAATASRVRFTAHGHVGQTRLEVYDASGNPVFDSGFRPGNVRDWSARDGGITDGAYACVLTARDLAGGLIFKQLRLSLAGATNSNGQSNTFIGFSAGEGNISGSGNTFVGTLAGRNNSGPFAHANSFFGEYAGTTNTTGTSNSFVGRGAGYSNETGSSNSF